MDRFAAGIVTSTAVAAAAAACAIVYFVHAGFSSRPEPSRVETFAAGHLRDWAYPAKYRNMKNPIACTPQVIEEAEAHWADHCAVCHGPDGSGNTMIGRAMYPRPPRMNRDGSAEMSDGEIYYTIQNGVRLTGMPAFGAAVDNDSDTWKLVCFIRQFPHLTPEQMDQVRAMEPKTPADLEEEKQEQEFLNGGTAQAPTPSHHHH